VNTKGEEEDLSLKQLNQQSLEEEDIKGEGKWGEGSELLLGPGKKEKPRKEGIINNTNSKKGLWVIWY